MSFSRSTTSRYTTTDTLGRRVPSDWQHVSKYPFMVFMPEAVENVEIILSLPGYREDINQLAEGACVGASSTWMMGILNRKLYDFRWLYHEAQQADEFPDTPPAEGTSVRAGLAVLKDKGHCVYSRRTKKTSPPLQSEGILEYRWAHNLDDVRTALSMKLPCVLGTNWYSSFDTPEMVIRKNIIKEYWIGRGESFGWGRIRGGHAICIYGASDKRQAVKLVNSWGFSYPPVWLPYTALERLMLREGGEVGTVTDRP